MLYSELEIKKLHLPHNIYSGAKHIPLSLQRPFHLIVLSAPISFQPDKYKSMIRHEKETKSRLFLDCSK